MPEQVIRHRGPMRDEDGKVVPASNVALTARAVEPQAGAWALDREGSKQRAKLAVYFWPAVDLTNDDELTVRGTRYKIDVGDWQSAFGTGRGGMRVFCTSGSGR